MIWWVLIVFFAGFFAGKFINTKWIGKYKIILVLTMLLLFSLGLEIGGNDELFSKIDSILLYGLLIALAGSVGSFLFGYITERLVNKK
ncbi:MAG: LysO family transporter [Fervidobacterium sp.]|uniref:LysO family transporter n=1 Tax=Fervidobacterium sp. TaxID=1871331 RepID=UPI0040496DCB